MNPPTVIAATTPMAAMVGTVPIGFALGTGAGLPAMYLIAGLIMFAFMTGYAAMSRHIVSTGAMYTYIRAGLGRIPGAGAAYLAVLSYVTFTIGAVGAEPSAPLTLHDKQQRYQCRPRPLRRILRHVHLHLLNDVWGKLRHLVREEDLVRIARRCDCSH